MSLQIRYPSRDFLFRVCYALLIPAQRVDHGRNTRGLREEYAWNTRLKQTVINDVFNKRFKRVNYLKRKNRGRL